MSDRRALMGALGSGGSSGSGIQKSVYRYAVTANKGSHIISINESASDIIFVHWYDEDAVYTTAGTAYEGCKLGFAAVHVTAFIDNNNWQNWRTHASNGTTGYYGAGTGQKTYEVEGEVSIAISPNAIVGHTLVVEVYYQT